MAAAGAAAGARRRRHRHRRAEPRHPAGRRRLGGPRAVPQRRPAGARRATRSAADLTDPDVLSRRAGRRGARTLVAITAWTRQADRGGEHRASTAARCATCWLRWSPPGRVRHVALMTGLKHYLGPFEAYAQGVMADTPFHEDEPRLDVAELLLRPGGRALRRRRARRLHLERAPLAHRVRLRDRQRDEHGADALRPTRRSARSTGGRSSSPARRPSGTASPT